MPNPVRFHFYENLELMHLVHLVVNDIQMLTDESAVKIARNYPIT